MNVCTSAQGRIPTPSLRSRFHAVFGVICIAAAVVSGAAVAGRAAVMHLDGRAALRAAHASAQPDLRPVADDDYVQLLTAIDGDDYVQLLPCTGDGPARPTGGL